MFALMSTSFSVSPEVHVAPVCGPILHDKIVGMDHNLGSYPNSTAAECCSICSATEGCGGWNMHVGDPSNPTFMKCLTHSNTSKSTWRNDTDSIAQLVTGATGCPHVQNGFWGSGHNVGPSPFVAAYTLCCAACREWTAANPTKPCVSWNWHSDSKQCYLHSSIEGYLYAKNVYGGVPSGPLPPTPPPTPQPGDYVTGFACRDPDASTTYKFCDTKLSLDERLDDLVPRVWDNETGTQLTARQSPNISRIGLPRYYWGTNAIHGVQNVQCIKHNTTSGNYTWVCPTAFPAASAISASWNHTHVKEMGRIIGMELRAYFNLRIHNSLDTWSPTININRDPRWGRNVESPGEDPLLNGLYGAAYTEGLQALEDEKEEGEVQAVVTLKHWLAYSVESYDNVTRTKIDSTVSAYDLVDTFLPPFKTAIVGGGALGVMCSYNAINGLPTCANPALNKTLRETWKFEGYITSDSDSCACIEGGHPEGPDNLPATPTNSTDAARQCLEGGTDIDSGGTYANNLPEALADREVSRATTDKALRNTYRMRMRLGLFEPNLKSKYRTYALHDIGRADSEAESLDAARQAMTLLKNYHGSDVNKATLPLPATATIAVVGQSANDTKGYLTGNYDGPYMGAPPPGIFSELARMHPATFCAGGTHPDADPAASAAAIKAGGATHVVLLVDNAHDGGGEGQDRYTISLGVTQIALAKAVLALKIPTVIVMINGGTISLDDLADDAGAILEAWMPGLQGGTAIAETLLGHNNPGGKLPVTIYHSSYINISTFLEMSITDAPGRTYRYYTGPAPMYEFGFGLSYTTFAMKWSPQPPSSKLDAAGSTTYTCEVTNTGKVAGDEVVQAFFKPSASLVSQRQLSDASTPSPIKQLFAFERVHLEAGASTKVTFTLNPTQHLSMVDIDGHRNLYAGEYDVVLTRGHGADLEAKVHVVLGGEATGATERLDTFEKWW